MRVSLIAAVAENGVIGSDGDLPWHLPADLARFKRLTMGHHLILGRKTFESIGRALPGRRMVVLSRGEPVLPDGVEPARSLDEALELARAAGDEEVFVVGGAAVYEQALPKADRLALTRVEAVVEGDVRFPAVDFDDWELVEEERRTADERNAFAVRFQTWDRL